MAFRRLRPLMFLILISCISPTYTHAMQTNVPAKPNSSTVQRFFSWCKEHPVTIGLTTLVGTAGGWLWWNRDANKQGRRDERDEQLLFRRSEARERALSDLEGYDVVLRGDETTKELRGLYLQERRKEKRKIQEEHENDMREHRAFVQRMEQSHARIQQGCDQVYDTCERIHQEHEQNGEEWEAQQKGTNEWWFEKLERNSRRVWKEQEERSEQLRVEDEQRRVENERRREQWRTEDERRRAEHERRMAQIRVNGLCAQEQFLRIYRPYTPAHSATAPIIATELAQTVEACAAQHEACEQAHENELVTQILIERYVHKNEDEYRQLLRNADEAVKQRVAQWRDEQSAERVRDLKWVALERKAAEWILRDIENEAAFNAEVQEYKQLLVAGEDDSAFIEEIENTLKRDLSFFRVEMNDGSESRFTARAVKALPYFQGLLNAPMREAIALRVSLPHFPPQDFEWVVNHALTCEMLRKKDVAEGRAAVGRSTRLINALNKEVPLPVGRMWQLADVADYVGHADGLAHIARFYLENLDEGQHPLPQDDDGSESTQTFMDKEIRRQYYLMHGTWLDNVEVEISDEYRQAHLPVNGLGIALGNG